MGKVELRPETAICKAFRRNLKMHMKEIGMSSAELSRRTYVSLSMIGLLLNGKRTPSIKTLAKIADGLDVKPEQLIG